MGDQTRLDRIKAFVAWDICLKLFLWLQGWDMATLKEVMEQYEVGAVDDRNETEAYYEPTETL